MNHRDSRLDPLDTVPHRPHRLVVAIIGFAMLAGLGLIYRYAGARWPGNATGHGAVDISETDARRPASASPSTIVLRNQAGATPAGGFHKPRPAAPE